MSRVAKVYRNALLVGHLTEKDNRTFQFEYNLEYFLKDDCPPVSLTMPKTKRLYESDILFPFFFNMLAEGVNRKVQLRQMQISEEDYFGLLLATSSKDSIGAIMVKEVKKND